MLHQAAVGQGLPPGWECILGGGGSLRQGRFLVREAAQSPAAYIPNKGRIDVAAGEDLVGALQYL